MPAARRGARRRRPGAGAFEQNLASETHQSGRPSAGLDADPAGFLDQTLVLDEAAEILLVQPHPQKRLDGTLQLQQGERRRHQLEHHRAVFDFAAQPPDRGGQDAAMVGRHRRSEGRAVSVWDRAAEYPPRLRDQAGLVKQLIALEDQFLVPRGAKGKPQALGSQPALGIAGRALGPSGEAVFERRQRRGLAGSPVLPREVAVPVLPHRLGDAAGPRLPHQRQIGNGQRPARKPVLAFDPVAVTKGVKLFDVAELLARLALNPSAQAHLEGPVLDFERAGGQGVDRLMSELHRQHARLIDGGRDNDRAQSD